MARMSKGEKIIRDRLTKARDDEEAMGERIKMLQGSLGEIRGRAIVFENMLADLEAPSPDSVDEDDDGGD